MLVKKSRLIIPLCRLLCYPRVCPVLEADVSKLRNEFVKGYREGDRCMYVSLYDENNKDLSVDDARVCGWYSHWVDANDALESDLAQDPELHQFRGLMFYVYEGNHRLTAWMQHIARHHKMIPHGTSLSTASFLMLEAKNLYSSIAMHDVNW